ncbi:MAG: hypothetical protein KatS3mg076_1397 [Candidatus Binatia bacterium]|nr:MAG: hypothetical protein KatS3mg076_1397 [Candidatus Binatia bacterium]
MTQRKDGRTRVELLPVAAAREAAEKAGVPVAFAELNIFRALLHRPATAKALCDLLLSLLFQGTLDPRLRELVIMRIGWVTGSDYEWTQHWRIAQERFGVTAEDLLAVRRVAGGGALRAARACRAGSHRRNPRKRRGLRRDLGCVRGGTRRSRGVSRARGGDRHVAPRLGAHPQPRHSSRRGGGLVATGRPGTGETTSGRRIEEVGFGDDDRPTRSRHRAFFFRCVRRRRTARVS